MSDDGIVISQTDVKLLGIKLMELQHRLSPNERAVLWSALAVAAAALADGESGTGATSRVTAVEDGDPLVVTVDTKWQQDSELSVEFPDMLAEAFFPEPQPAASKQSAATTPGPTDADKRKIGGVSAGIKICPPRSTG